MLVSDSEGGYYADDDHARGSERVQTVHDADAVRRVAAARRGCRQDTEENHASGDNEQRHKSIRGLHTVCTIHGTAQDQELRVGS